MFEPGTQLGRYEIQRRLGRGGMGTVYVAHDPVLGRMVAIKVFAGDLDMPDARERFSREARAAAALNHPNIVTVYDFGDFDSQPYIVMEYVPGETLANLIRRKVVVSMADKLRWMEELCAGAGYAHQMLVIHRDIKPANLMIDRAGRLKILDFGIARLLGIASNTSVMIGTPGYMAPEQITGDPVDHRSDQFSIGVVFYELLAYTDAFPGDTPPAITHRILTEEPKPLARVAADVSPVVAAIVEQALKKNIDERFATTDSMRAAIARVRRHFESDGSDTFRPAAGRDITPPGGATRGTGSSRRPVSDAVGVAEMTPPPDPRRSDRAALARRRAAQVEAALAHARELLEQQQFDAAFDACQQARTLDENHAGALALEEEIEIALERRKQREAPADDPDVTFAGESPVLDSGALSLQYLDSQPTRLDEDAFEVVESPPASEEPGISAPRIGTGAGELTALHASAPPDATIVVPGRRTPQPVMPAQPVTPAPVTRQTTVPDSQRQEPVDTHPAVDRLARLKAIAPSALSRKALALSGSAGIAALVAIGAGAYLLTRGPIPTGTVVIDAVPWATVTAIKAQNGALQSVPASASTPLSVALPAGTYEITLAGPAPTSQIATVTVSVGAGGVSIVPISRFQTMTADEYFEQYLGSPTSSAEPQQAVTTAAAGVAQ